MNIRNILVAADFSAYSEDAFGVACALARDYGAHLIVVHVIEPTEESSADAEPPDKRREKLEKRFRKVYGIDSLSDVEYRVLEGDPAENHPAPGAGEELRSSDSGDPWPNRADAAGDGQRRRSNCPRSTLPRPDHQGSAQKHSGHGRARWRVDLVGEFEVALAGDHGPWPHRPKPFQLEALR